MLGTVCRSNFSIQENTNFTIGVEPRALKGSYSTVLSPDTARKVLMWLSIMLMELEYLKRKYIGKKRLIRKGRKNFLKLVRP